MMTDYDYFTLRFILDKVRKLYQLFAFNESKY